MAKKKPTVDPIIHITPLPLEHNAYILQKSMTQEEIRAFKLAWERMNREQDTHRMVIYLPEDVDFRVLPKEQLKYMKRQIEEALKELETDD